jgi:hypothetical protein
VFAGSPLGDRTKNPWPWIDKSVFLPVGWNEPSVKMVSMLARPMPRPTCIGFVPPRPAPVGDDAPCIVWLSTSWNCTGRL